MSPVLGALVAYGVFLALVLGVLWMPRLAGTVVSIALTTASCVELAHGRIPNAVTALIYGAAFWLLVVVASQNAPRKRRTSP